MTNKLAKKIIGIFEGKAKNCPRCKAQLSKQARICPECDYNFYYGGEERPIVKKLQLNYNLCCAAPLVLIAVLIYLIYEVPALQKLLLVALVISAFGILAILLYFAGLVFKVKRMFSIFTERIFGFTQATSIKP